MHLKGVFTASLTPMKPDLSIDYDRLIRHGHRILDMGCDGIAFLGTTGEANSFSVEERLSLIDAVGKSGLPKNRILIGTGCCALPDTVRLSRHALSNGFTGLLILPPFYYKNLSDAGLAEYFHRLMDSLNDERVKIILYHFPKLSGVPFSIQLLERLIKDYPKNICGIKDSGGNFENMRAMAKAFPGFAVFSGTEKFLLPVLEAGGGGCISATANITGRYAAAIYKGYQKGRPVVAEQEQLTSVRSAMDAYPLIGMLKKFMEITDHDPEWQHIRPPNIGIGPPEFRVLTEKLNTLGFRL
jgi:4-hydroxy-tetrahydrodipicolinate synthase